MLLGHRDRDRLVGSSGSVERRTPDPWGFPQRAVNLRAGNLLSMFLEMTWGPFLVRVSALTDIGSEGF